MKRLKNIKIVFLDIDGTLVNDKGRISFKTKRSIKRLVNRGVYVVLTSGRHTSYVVYKSMKALASSIVISSNGAEIFDYSSKKFIYSNYISYEKVSLVYKFCEKNKIGAFFNTSSGRYINKFLIGINKCEDKLFTTLKEIKKFDVSQIVFVCDSNEKLLLCNKFTSEVGLDIAYFSKSFKENEFDKSCSLDLINKGVSKGSSALYLMDTLGIDKADSICFGDFINDIDLFNVCGYKVAMENACSELKEKADFVTLSNNKNGIAYFIDKYM